MFEFEFSGYNCFSYIDTILVDQSNTLNETLTSNIYSNKGLWVGSYVNGFFKSKCEIAEIILYSKKLNSLEKERLYFYINQKYNLF
jgi:hypothetical protein